MSPAVDTHKESLYDGVIRFPGHLEGFGLYTISYWQKTIIIITGKTTAIIMKTL